MTCVVIDPDTGLILALVPGGNLLAVLISDYPGKQAVAIADASALSVGSHTYSFATGTFTPV